MTLHLRAACDVIAALSVTNGTETVTFKDLDEVGRGYTSADCPLALVLPADDEISGDFTSIALDSSGAITWNIGVLYIEAPFEEGAGWTQHAEAVATFVENFIQALIDAKATFCTANVMFVGATPRRGVFEYPMGSQSRYYGAMFFIRVQDFSRIS